MFYYTLLTQIFVTWNETGTFKLTEMHSYRQGRIQKNECNWQRTEIYFGIKHRKKKSLQLSHVNPSASVTTKALWELWERASLDSRKPLEFRVDLHYIIYVCSCLDAPRMILVSYPVIPVSARHSLGWTAGKGLLGEQMVEKKGEEPNESTVSDKRRDVRPSCESPSINLHCC